MAGVSDSSFCSSVTVCERRPLLIDPGNCTSLESRPGKRLSSAHGTPGLGNMGASSTLGEKAAKKAALQCCDLHLWRQRGSHGPRGRAGRHRAGCARASGGRLSARLCGCTKQVLYSQHLNADQASLYFHFNYLPSGVPFHKRLRTCVLLCEMLLALPLQCSCTSGQCRACVRPLGTPGPGALTTPPAEPVEQLPS